MAIVRVQGLFAGVDETQPAESQLGSCRCYNRRMWLLAEDWQGIIQIYVQMDKYMVECYRNDELTLTSTWVEEVQHNVNVYVWDQCSSSIAWSSCATNGVDWCGWFSQFMQRQVSLQSKCPLRHLQRCMEQPDVHSHMIRSNKACGAAGRVIHWISTEEWLAGSSPHSGLQSQPLPCGPGREQPGWRARRHIAAWQLARQTCIVEHRVLAEDLKIARRQQSNGPTQTNSSSCWWQVQNREKELSVWAGARWLNFVHFWTQTMSKSSKALMRS